MKALNCDVLIYGGTVSGIAAALAASRGGASVVLAERGDHLGGMTASGLGSIDTLRENAFGGIFSEFLKRVRDHYTAQYGERSEQYRLTYGGFFMEPHVAERVLNEMLDGARGVQVLTRTELVAVERDGPRVSVCQFRSRDTGEEVRVVHRAAIDSTYEGDLAAAAGAPFRTGREGRDEFGESFAGVIFYDWRSHRNQIHPASTGEPSEHLQANCFRLTLSDDARTRIPIPKPDSYTDCLPRYRRLLDDFYRGRVRFLREVLWLNPLANRKYCLNGHIEALTSSDLAGLSAAWATGDWAAREDLYRQYRDYTLGLLYFLQNDPGVPKVPREEVGCFGLPADEYTGNGNFPWQLYVRQARRICGDYLVTQHDSTPAPGRQRPAIHRDAIAICEHRFDSHACRDRDEDGAVVLTEDGFELLEGVIWFRYLDKNRSPNRPATIPYRAMLPEGIEGLLVACGAVSATNVAFSAIRMEPAYMALGQAAGTAAALAVAGELGLRSVDASRLQEKLLANGQVLVYFDGLTPADPDFVQLQRKAIAEDWPDYDAARIRGEL